MIRRRKRRTADWWDGNPRLAKMDSTVLFEFGEANIMQAGQQMSLYHQSKWDLVHLKLAFDHTRIAGIAQLELVRRQELLGNSR